MRLGAAKGECLGKMHETHRNVKTSSLAQAVNASNPTCSATGEPGLLVRRMLADHIRTQDNKVENRAGKGTNLKTVFGGERTLLLKHLKVLQ